MSYMGLVPAMVDFCEQIKENRRQSRGPAGRIQILEIGVDRGQTSIPLMHNLINRGIEFDWVGVDIRRDDNFGQQVILMEGVDPDDLEGVSSQSRVFYIIENSLKFLAGLVGQHVFDLVLIDGDHNYDTVKEELSHIPRITHPMSLVICDDYGGRHANKDDFYRRYQTHEHLKDASTHLQEDLNKGGVTRAVDEFIAEHNWSLHKPHGVIESVIIMNKLRFSFKTLNKVKDIHAGRSIMHSDECVHRFDFGNETWYAGRNILNIEYLGADK